MYIEVNGNLICMNNADIVYEKENNSENYLIYKCLINDKGEKMITVLSKHNLEETKTIMNHIKDGINSGQKIIRIPTKEELERWSE